MSASFTTFTVIGMTCDHCVRAVHDELVRLDGVDTVEVDLPSGRVAVGSEVSLDELRVRAAVEEAGYAFDEAVGIRHGDAVRGEGARHGDGVGHGDGVQHGDA
jgi:copper chaperone